MPTAKESSDSGQESEDEFEHKPSVVTRVTPSARGFGYGQDSNAVDQDLRLDLEARRQFFLIFKECANNIARHSGCSQVKFRFAVEARRLVLRADDNGKGFNVLEASQGASGQGLASMRLRAERLGGNVTLDSAEHEGTTVTVSVPLRK